MNFFDHRPSKFPLTAVDDYRLIAKKRLPKQLFNFLESGAFDETTLQKNTTDFQKILLKRRVLKDVSNISMAINLFDQNMDFPLALSPVGYAGMFGRRGEVQAAKAAANANIPFSLSTVGICSLEEVSQQSQAPFWFQFYMFKDRIHSLDLLQRAQDVKCPVLLMTADLPVVGSRYRYHRGRRSSKFANFLDFISHLKWWADVRLMGGPLTIGNLPRSAPLLSDLSSMRKWMGNQLGLSWNDFEWIRANWKGKILIKGILDSQDALIAQKMGADGIVVSNHGGRHFDGTPSSIEVLSDIRDAVGPEFKVLLDGGIKSGLDLFKALAIGADACMIGRPWVYGLASRGEEGVSDIIAILKTELKIVMAHMGVTSIADINRSLIIESTSPNNPKRSS